MKKKGILAIDIGTSSIRVSVYIKGECIKKQYVSLEKGEARFSAELLWDNLMKLVKKATNDETDIWYEAVGVSAFLGWVVVNRFGKPVEDAWSWMAHGDKEEVEQYKSVLPEDTPTIIGRKINEELGVFRWGKMLRKTKGSCVVLSIKDYINFKLTGEMKMDRAHASYTGLFSINQNDWEPRLLDTYQIDLASLPRLADGYDEVGTLIPEIAVKLGLQSETKVATCGPDGTLAILGGGGTIAGKTVEVMGTTDVFFHLTENIDTEEVIKKGLVKNSYILPGLYAVGGPTGMTGGALTWLMENWNWTFESEPYKDLLRLWESIKPAEEGLFVIPSLTGSRVPDWSQTMKGTIVGLTPSHTTKDIYKATVEGIAFSTKAIFERLESVKGPIDSLIAIGGGARNETFIRTRAAAIGRSIYLPKEIEASTFGAIALTGTMLHWFDNVQTAVSTLNPVNHEITTSMNEVEQYRKWYKQYNLLITNMMAWYNKKEQ